MIRLLHLSDIHLNTGFANKNPYVRERLKVGLWRSFERACHYVIQEQVDGLLLVGDLFDHGQISYALERQCVTLIRKMLNAKRHIFYVTGNHDPMHTASFLDLFKEDPYMHFFVNDAIGHQVVTFSSGEICEFIGCGHKSKNEQRDLIATYPVKANQHYWVGLAHASVSSAQTRPDKMAYMASQRQTIEQLNYDYFALGHIHIRQILNDRMAYSGNIQGLNYKETGDKGGLLVTLDHQNITTTPISFNEVQWEAYDFVVDASLTSLAEIEKKILSAITMRIEEVPFAANRIIVRIHLKGKTKCYHALKDEETLSEMGEGIANAIGLLHVDLKDTGLSHHVDEAALKSETTVLATALDMIETPDQYPLLLKELYSHPCFEGMTSDSLKREKLEQLLRKTRVELIDRMVKVTYDH
jgi:DNA repair exonuclease SbcCD nuclease subunit